ncbi:glycoside hydrolase family 15 protein [Candidatus Parcubacteria bacterium]|nr:MAG: glycoside hydrolase family 15 protein [Candidatus Parcubacteria bacterium]
MNRKEKIKNLINKSKQILNDNALDNGAISAANPDKDYYPREAKDYHYIWPRDASYICVAANLAGIKNIQEPFFDWLTKRPEDFEKEGLLFGSYSTNGRLHNNQFQPDQAGSILWAIYDFYKDDLNRAKKQELLIRRIADGLTNDWKGKYFFHNTVDLWEEGERKTSTKIGNNHTYSLAACCCGLKFANQIIKNDKWMEAADQMKKQIEEAYSAKRKYFLRNHGKIDDFNIDASLIGLVYPFNIYKPSDRKILNTINAIEKSVVIDGGVHRYQFDYYDGEGTAQEGSGAWPLLNFWLSIYWSLLKNRKKAEKYYNWVIERITDDYLIPEQIFSDFRQGIKPLAWSHAMFLIASNHLGYLKK